MTALAKPRRSRANLRPPSRSACVIDRLRKNQDPLEKRNNFRSSLAAPGRGQTSGEPRRNFSVGNFMDTRAMAVPIAGIRFGHSRLDGEPVGGRRLARRVTRWLAASTIEPPGSSALFNRGWLLSPSRYSRPQNRGAVIQALPAAG